MPWRVIGCNPTTHYDLTWVGVAALYLTSAVAMFTTPKPISMSRD